MLTRNKVILIQEEVKAAMTEIAQKHGLTAGAVKMSFTSSEIKMVTGFSDKEATGGIEIDPIYVRNLLRNGPSRGIFAKAGTAFKLGGLDYVLHGMRGNFVVIYRVAEKKLYRYDPMLVSSCLNEAGLNHK